MINDVARSFLGIFRRRCNLHFFSLLPFSLSISIRKLFIDFHFAMWCDAMRWWWARLLLVVAFKFSPFAIIHCPGCLLSQKKTWKDAKTKTWKNEISFTKKKNKSERNQTMPSRAVIYFSFLFSSCEKGMRRSKILRRTFKRQSHSTPIKAINARSIRGKLVGVR